jgi:hypothetical protein
LSKVIFFKPLFHRYRSNAFTTSFGRFDNGIISQNVPVCVFFLFENHPLI